MTELAPPVVDSGVEFSADRRRADGSRTYWATSAGENGSVLRRWDERNGAWVEGLSTSADSWLDAVAATDALWFIRVDEATDFVVPDERALLDRLSPLGTEDSRHLDWATDVDEFRSAAEGLPPDNGLIVRFVTVNGTLVYFGAAAGRTRAMGEDFIWPDGTSIATLTSWGWTHGPYHSELVAAPTYAVATQWDRNPDGETYPPSVTAFVHDGSISGIARAVLAWLDTARQDVGGVSTAAAIALEPLDPEGALTEAQRSDWDWAFSWDYYRHTTILELRADGPTRTELRRILAEEDEEYVRVKAALAAPADNDWLRHALSEDEIDSLG